MTLYVIKTLNKIKTTELRDKSINGITYQFRRNLNSSYLKQQNSSSITTIHTFQIIANRLFFYSGRRSTNQTLIQNELQ